MHFEVKNYTRFILPVALAGLLLILYGLFLAHPINLVTADLGRHIKNGELFFETWHPLEHNFYSYTEPEYPALNHHWGSGAIFYLVWRVTGFTGIQLFVIALNSAAFLIAFLLAYRCAGAGIAALAAIFMIPLLAERTELRPESFSYLFVMLFFLVLWRSRESNGTRALWLLPALEIAWVNLHIYFFLGPLLVLAFLAEALLVRNMRRARQLVWICAAIAITTLVSPFGFAAAIAPFTILREYGYLLVENQSVWFLETMLPGNPNYRIFKIAFMLLLASFVPYAFPRVRARMGSWQSATASMALALGVSAMGWLQLRNFALFGLVALPLLAGNAGALFRAQAKKYEMQLSALAAAILVFAIMAMMAGGMQKFFPYARPFGLGLIPGNSAAADFFRAHDLKGPIFNNYDIGGYLIYYLFPQERVFVDNRPEAYSVDFFKKIYVPMQESADAWEKYRAQYGFNVIIFSYRDHTPWAQQFLIARIQDPEWVPVFADAQVIVFVRATKDHAPLIAEYAIPRERFGVSTVAP